MTHRPTHSQVHAGEYECGYEGEGNDCEHKYLHQPGHACEREQEIDDVTQTQRSADTVVPKAVPKARQLQRLSAAASRASAATLSMSIVAVTTATALIGMDHIVPSAYADKKQKQLAPLESRLVGDPASITQQYTDIQKTRPSSTDKQTVTAPAAVNQAVTDPVATEPAPTSETLNAAADPVAAKAVELEQSQPSNTVATPASDSTDISGSGNRVLSNDTAVTVIADTETNDDEFKSLSPDNIQPDMLGIRAQGHDPAQATIFRDNAAILRQPNVLETVVTTTTYGNDKTETVTEVISVDPTTLDLGMDNDVAGRTTPQTAIANEQPQSWQTVTISKGDTLVSLFQSLGIDPALAVRIAESDQHNSLSQLTVGRQISLLTHPGGQFGGLRYDLSADRRLEAHYRNDGNIVIDNINLAPVQPASNASEEKVAFGFIKSSLFEAGLGVGLDPILIANFANIFGYEIDFSMDLRRGDRFSLIYNENYQNGEKVRGGDILAAEFINNGERHRAIRHVDESGKAQFYTPDGFSLRKAFFRSPVEFTRITSSFSNRRFHPVLKQWKAHRGVDYAAAAGTPVLATAEGVISHRSAMGGYGRTVIIRHNNDYETLYAHLSDYGRGQQVGHTVHQGQVIGYVGQSGNATGPHLHYEFRVKGRHRDPLTVISDQGPGERIPDKYLPEFQDTASLFSSRLDSLNAEIAQNRTNQDPDRS